MKVEEKARELVDSFMLTQRGFVMPIIVAKQCALIAVGEILSELEEPIYEDSNYSYWSKVKQEIENLK